MNNQGENFDAGRDISVNNCTEQQIPLPRQRISGLSNEILDICKSAGNVKETNQLDRSLLAIATQNNNDDSIDDGIDYTEE